MARLYTDEDFPRPVSEKLRNMGHDVLTCQESGRAGQGIRDESVFAYAVAASRAVLTLNRRHYYRRLHRMDRKHFGVVVCTKNDNHDELAQCIHKALLAQPNLAGELVRVCRPG